MTCRAIRHDTGEESIPLLLVRNGDLTPRQCDHEFKGKTGDCPSCKLQIETADLDDGSSYAAAMVQLRDRGVGVAYKRFGYGSDGGVEPWRVCYWGHPPGYWEGVPFRDCQNQDTDTHRINLEVIRRYYERSFKPELGFVIKVEQRLRRPGDPPRPYSPDLAIYGPKGERLVAVEYQRSYEAFEKFLDRDTMRRAAPESWAAVDWWLDDTQPDPERPRQTVYERSQMHRTYLSSLSVNHYRCWVDPDTLKLLGDYGAAGNLPPERRKRVERHIEKTELRECSTAKIMRQIEDEPEFEIVKEYVAPLRPRSGSELDFLGDLNYSLERERRVALAVIARQKRHEEQDRRQREYEAKCRLVEQIKALLPQLAVLPDIESDASVRWTVERLEQELKWLEDQLPQARQVAEQQRMAEYIAEFNGQYTVRELADYSYDDVVELYEATREQVAEEKRQADQEAIARRQAAEEAYRAEQQRLADERQRLWELQNAELAEKRRQQREEDLHWHPIEARDELIRGQQVIKTVLLPGDRVRRGPGHREEIYQGVSGAGMSTDHYTYETLLGWQVRRNRRRA